ncbi:MAG: hypothetical protein OXF20_12330 [Gammaproteobacteria bacterium]|nr:hypothetical protein [Gammaproteobacteria bacterium]
MNIPPAPKQQGHEHSTSFSREKPPQLHLPGGPHGARDAPRAAGTRGDRPRADAGSGQQPGLSPRHNLRDLHADGEVPGGRSPSPRGADARRADGVPVAAVRRHAGRLAAAGRQEPAVEGRPAGGSRRVLEAALQGRNRVTLDIDASAVHAKKKTARRTLPVLHKYSLDITDWEVWHYDAWEALTPIRKPLSGDGSLPWLTRLLSAGTCSRASGAPVQAGKLMRRLAPGIAEGLALKRFCPNLRPDRTYG